MGHSRPLRSPPATGHQGAHTLHTEALENFEALFHPFLGGVFSIRKGGLIPSTAELLQEERATTHLKKKKSLLCCKEITLTIEG